MGLYGHPIWAVLGRSEQWERFYYDERGRQYSQIPLEEHSNSNVNYNPFRLFYSKLRTLQSVNLDMHLQTFDLSLSR